MPQFPVWIHPIPGMPPLQPTVWHLFMEAANFPAPPPASIWRLRTVLGWGCALEDRGPSGLHAVGLERVRFLLKAGMCLLCRGLDIMLDKGQSVCSN